MRHHIKEMPAKQEFHLGSSMVGLMVLLMVVGFFYMPYDPNAMDTENALQFFSLKHPLAPTSLAVTF